MVFWEFGLRVPRVGEERRSACGGAVPPRRSSVLAPRARTTDIPSPTKTKGPQMRAFCVLWAKNAHFSPLHLNQPLCDLSYDIFAHLRNF
jgi:hypothetical protein